MFNDYFCSLIELVMSPLLSVFLAAGCQACKIKEEYHTVVVRFQNLFLLKGYPNDDLLKGYPLLRPHTIM